MSTPSSNEIEEMLDDILKTIRKPGRKMTKGLDLGSLLIDPSFDNGRDDETLMEFIGEFVKEELSQARTLHNVRTLDVSTHSAYEQIKLDVASGNPNLQNLTFIYAYYFLNVKDVSLTNIVDLSPRALTLRRETGRNAVALTLAKRISMKSATPKGDHAVKDSVPPEPQPKRTIVENNIPRTKHRDAADHRYDQTRQHLLDAMRDEWIEDYYKNIFEQRAPIVLRMVNRPKTVMGPWVDVEQGKAQPEGVQDQGTTIVDVWERYRHALLILGEAGVGKTIALLQLANALLQRAYADATKPVPVYVHLATWVEGREPLAVWLRNELNTRYGVKPAWSQRAMDDAALVLLLDGLDDVPEEQQVACIKAINTFRDDNVRIGMALCYRLKKADDEPPARPHLRAAIQLQPLSPEEIDQQLATSTSGMDPTTPSADASWYELLATPLMLDTYIKTYGVAQPMTTVATTASEFRRGLFDAYIVAMFKRKREKRVFELDETRRYLAWIARQMLDLNEPFFEIERLDSRWLSEDTRTNFVRMVRFWRGLVIGIATGLLASTGLLIMLVELIGKPFGIQLSWWVYVLALGLGCGSLAAFFGLYARQHVTEKSNERIEPVEELYWSTPIRWSFVAAGAFVGVLLMISTAPLYGPLWAAILGMSLILTVTVLSNLSALGGRSHTQRTRPNQGIRRSGRYALLFGALTFGVVSPFMGFITSLSVGDGHAWITGSAFGVGITVIMLFYFGGDAWVVHWLLRRALEREGAIPRRLPALLDHAVERVLMRRAGGSYMFLHDLFQVHLASSTDDRSGLS